jgi:hypothetical protein
MTSEVVVMNRLGIALASDSAATVYVGGRAKFYHADKLFMLSNHHPVGVMVYNNSSLLGVPWETILKMIRADLGTDPFDTLEEYAGHLIGYLNNNTHLFPADVQRKYYLNLVRMLFGGIQKGVNERFMKVAQEALEDVPTALKQTQATVVKETLDEWRKKPDVDPLCFDAAVGSQLAGQVSGEINGLIAQHFDGADYETVAALTELARLVVSKDEILPESLSGLVIAGFGEKQFFPVMQEYELGEIFLGRLKYRCTGTSRIDSDTPSVVRPFAQSEMVRTFLEGVSPALLWFFTEQVVKFVLTSADQIVEGMPGVSRRKKEAYKRELLPISANAAKKFVGALDQFRDRRHFKPILQSIEFLPKNELAHVAQSLVNLSTFQKRMSISEDETVGGPIDVAVISKGDGFVWIDRKHYFRPELNRQFFQRQSSKAGKAKPQAKTKTGEGSDE